MFDKLPRDILLYCILPYLRDAEMRILFALCKRTNRIVHEYCLADKTSTEVLCERGDLLIIYKRGLIVDNVEDFELICEKGYLNFVKKSYAYHNLSYWCVYGLQGACLGGYRKTVDLMIAVLTNNGLEHDSEDHYWDFGLEKACRGGHLEIVNLMIEKGADDWNRGMVRACRGGHREIIDLMIENGADWWDFGMSAACQGGHREIVDLMIKNGANDWNLGLYKACHRKHKEIIKLMIEKGAEKCGNCNKKVEDHL